jgi:hypothetical protein
MGGAEMIGEFLGAFGIRSTPWVIRVYPVLLLVCVGVMFFAVGQVPSEANSEHPAIKLLTLAMDSFKIVLGAVIGALSMAANRQWGKPDKDEPEADHE